MAGKSRLQRLRQGEGGGGPEEAGVDGRGGDEAGEHHRRGRPRSRAARLPACLLLFSAFCELGKDPASESGGVLCAPSSWSAGFIVVSPAEALSKVTAPTMGFNKVLHLSFIQGQLPAPPLVRGCNL